MAEQKPNTRRKPKAQFKVGECVIVRGRDATFEGKVLSRSYEVESGWGYKVSNDPTGDLNSEWLERAISKRDPLSNMHTFPCVHKNSTQAKPVMEKSEFNPEKNKVIMMRNAFINRGRKCRPYPEVLIEIVGISGIDVDERSAHRWIINEYKNN
jgi:hypothetical protein